MNNHQRLLRFNDHLSTLLYNKYRINSAGKREVLDETQLEKIRELKARLIEDIVKPYNREKKE